MAFSFLFRKFLVQGSLYRFQCTVYCVYLILYSPISKVIHSSCRRQEAQEVNAKHPSIVVLLSQIGSSLPRAKYGKRAGEDVSCCSLANSSVALYLDFPP